MRARCVMRGEFADLVVQQATNFPAECNQPNPIPFQEPNPMIFPVAFIIRCLNVAYPKIPTL